MNNLQPDQMAEASAKGETKGALNRRMFIGGATAGLALVAAEAARQVGLWHLADLGIGPLASLEINLKRQQAKLLEDYRADPAVAADVTRVIPVFMHSELVAYLRRGSKLSTSSYEDFNRNYFRSFFDKVAKNYEIGCERSQKARQDKNDTEMFNSQSVALIAEWKKALFMQIGEQPHYWKQKNNVIDPLVSSDLQCRSGSWLLVLTLLENVDQHLQQGERLVLIHSNHHVQPGLLTADQRLIAFEMTVAGKAIQDRGFLADLTEPLLVCDAKHSLIQSALGCKLHEERTVIFDNVPKTFTRIDKSEIPSGNAFFGFRNLKLGLGGTSTATSDAWGFGDGKLEVPEGRIPMPAIDYLPAGLTTSTQNGESGSIYDSLTHSRNAGSSLKNLFSPQELKAFEEYEFHFSMYKNDLQSILDSHSKVMSSRTDVDLRSEMKNILDKGKRLVYYMQKNDINAKYQAFEQSMKSMAKRNPGDYSYARNPLDIVKQVVNSLSR